MGHTESVIAQMVQGECRAYRFGVGIVYLDEIGTPTEEQVLAVLKDKQRIMAET